MQQLGRRFAASLWPRIVNSAAARNPDGAVASVGYIRSAGRQLSFLSKAWGKTGAGEAPKDPTRQASPSLPPIHPATAGDTNVQIGSPPRPESRPSSFAR